MYLNMVSHASKPKYDIPRSFRVPLLPKLRSVRDLKPQHYSDFQQWNDFWNRDQSAFAGPAFGTDSDWDDELTWSDLLEASQCPWDGEDHCLDSLFYGDDDIDQHLKSNHCAPYCPDEYTSCEPQHGKSQDFELDGIQRKETITRGLEYQSILPDPDAESLDGMIVAWNTFWT